MANNRIEEYLEAILGKIADGTETDIPRPSWNIEKYLAAIYEALSEGGSGGGVLLVNISFVDRDTAVLDKTWAEIKAAVDRGELVMSKLVGDNLQGDPPTYNAGFEPVSVAKGVDADDYNVYTLGNTEFHCSSPDEYPTATL